MLLGFGMYKLIDEFYTFHKISRYFTNDSVEVIFYKITILPETHILVANRVFTAMGERR